MDEGGTENGGPSLYFFYYLPLGLDIRRRRRTVITYFIAALSVLVFICYNYLPVNNLWNPFMLLFFPENPDITTALAHAFFHTGWMHLIGNMVYLVVFGRPLEDRFGSGKFFTVFALSAIGGAYGHTLLARAFAPSFLGTAIAGASGATSGLLGAFLVRFYYGRIRVAYWIFMPLQAVNRAGKTSVPVIMAVLFWFLYQGAHAAVQFGTKSLAVAYGVHLGGFLSGAALAFVMGGFNEARDEKVLVKARGYFRKADWFSAQSEYMNYIDSHPRDAVACAEAARSFVCTRDAVMAGKYFSKSVRLFRKAGRRERAEEVFLQAVRNVPFFMMGEKEYLDLAFGSERSMKFSGAAEAYENFLNIYPASTDRPLVLVRLAKLYGGRLERPENAERYLEELLREHPDCEWIELARMKLDSLRRNNISLEAV